ncbi:MAG: hypothetical protein K0R93_1528 [Anaerosolibacter sp.]|uniref:DUF192 domain-containing protein n=1 Tax=Anaerosolibacter sp. TaxID=1872527 RepID=UPI0026031B49|nr:DUF192 domain-containing protein [Anaerosolibacter sp.]MDF2546630.1 hypothetical protein [Anaerosolibacter sp.]
MLKNVSTGQLLIRNLEHANTPEKATRGLLGRSRIDNDYGMIIYHCQSIHTCYMKFAIDVVFLDINKRIIYIVKDMGPWQYTGYIKESVYAIESKPGSFTNHIKIRDQLTWQ